MRLLLLMLFTTTALSAVAQDTPPPPGVSPQEFYRQQYLQSQAKSDHTPEALNQMMLNATPADRQHMDDFAQKMKAASAAQGMSPQPAADMQKMLDTYRQVKNPTAQPMAVPATLDARVQQFNTQNRQLGQSQMATFMSRIQTVSTEIAARTPTHHADAVALATDMIAGEKKFMQQKGWDWQTFNATRNSLIKGEQDKVRGINSPEAQMFLKYEDQMSLLHPLQESLLNNAQ